MKAERYFGNDSVGNLHWRENAFRSGNARSGRRNIDLAIVMPGACVALLVPAEMVTGMIVGNGGNKPHAHVEHGNERCYPTPFHPVSHSYCGSNQLSSLFR
jgi:hypothetical protein